MKLKIVIKLALILLQFEETFLIDVGFIFEFTINSSRLTVTYLRLSKYNSLKVCFIVIKAKDVNQSGDSEPQFLWKFSSLG